MRVTVAFSLRLNDLFLRQYAKITLDEIRSGDNIRLAACQLHFGDLHPSNQSTVLPYNFTRLVQDRRTDNCRTTAAGMFNAAENG